MSTTISPNMNLPVPVVSVEPGPAWATDINNCMATIDSHDHSSGKGVQVTPAGLNINSDLSFNNSNATLMRTVRFKPNPTIGASDLDAAFVNGVDLYYVDGNGNQVRITQSGAVAGTPGSIANLVAPASASYVSGTQTFVFQSDVNTAANIDGGSFILRDITANSKGVTLSAPTSLAADYTVTMPAAVPGALSLVQMDASGNLSTETKITTAQLPSFNSATSSSCGVFITTSSTPVSVTNLSVTITTTGRPVFVGLIPDGTGNASAFGTSITSTTTSVVSFSAILNINRGVTNIFTSVVEENIRAVSGDSLQCAVPPSSVWTIDAGASAGSNTYSVTLLQVGVNANAVLTYAKLIAYEL